MKIRSGFVSNSSSSSFIVAFPKKPKTSEDVLHMMFDKDISGEITSDYRTDKLSHKQVCDIVFKDIKDNGMKRATKKELIRLLENKYFAYNGRLYYPRNKYFAIDSDLVDKYIQAEIECDTAYRECSRYENEYTINKFGKSPPWAYKGGINHNTNLPYTKAEIKAFDDYHKKVDDFKAKDKEFLAKTREYESKINALMAKQTMLRGKLAELDLEAFLKDNPKAFIVTLSYSDNDGSTGCMMEHSNIFRNLNHITISQH